MKINKAPDSALALQPQGHCALTWFTCVYPAANMKHEPEEHKDTDIVFPTMILPDVRLVIIKTLDEVVGVLCK